MNDIVNVKGPFKNSQGKYIHCVIYLNLHSKQELHEHERLHAHKAFTVDRMSHVVRKPIFGVADQVRHKPGCTATEDG